MSLFKSLLMIFADTAIGQDIFQIAADTAIAQDENRLLTQGLDCDNEKNVSPNCHCPKTNKITIKHKHGDMTVHTDDLPTDKQIRSKYWATDFDEDTPYPFVFTPIIKWTCPSGQMQNPHVVIMCDEPAYATEPEPENPGSVPGGGGGKSGIIWTSVKQRKYDVVYAPPCVAKICPETTREVINGQAIQVGTVPKGWRKHTKSTRKFRCLGNGEKKKSARITCNNGTWESKRNVCKEPVCAQGDYTVFNTTSPYQKITVHLDKDVEVNDTVRGTEYTCDGGKGSATLRCNSKQKLVVSKEAKRGAGVCRKPLCVDYSGFFSKGFPAYTKVWGVLGRSKTGVSKSTCRENCKEYKYFARSEEMKCRCGNKPEEVDTAKDCKCDDLKSVGKGKSCVYQV